DSASSADHLGDPVAARGTLLLQPARPPPDLHPFPTRRSSDLFWHTSAANNARKLSAMRCTIAVNPLNVDSFTSGHIKGAVFRFNLNISRRRGAFRQPR